jgi:hypothetical protein
MYTSCVIVGWGLTLLMISRLPIKKKKKNKTKQNNAQIWG